MKFSRKIASPRSARFLRSARSLRSLLPGVLAATAAMAALAGPAHAWKPKTHVYLAEQALKDALDDGSVEIAVLDPQSGRVLRTVTCPVNGEILAALRSSYRQYRAGILGPDAYPDILTGQQIIHPDRAEALDGDRQGGTNAFLTHLWSKAFQQPVSGDANAARAFVVGYLTHAAGDMWAHTYVNYFTGGEFEMGTNAAKHLVLEGYIGKRTPLTIDSTYTGTDTSTITGSSFSRLVDSRNTTGIVTDGIGAAFGLEPRIVTENDTSIAGLENFIYENLIDARPGSILEQRLLKGSGTNFSVPFIFSKLKAGLQADVDRYYRLSKFDQTKYTLTHPGQITYKEAWIKDIDEGLKAWPAVSHKIAAQLVYPETGMAGGAKGAKEVLAQYVRDHMAEMIGAPKVGVVVLSALGDAGKFVTDTLNALLPDLLVNAVAEMKRDALNFIVQHTIIFTSTGKGLTIEEWEDLLKNPETRFNLMPLPGGDHPAVGDRPAVVSHPITMTEFNQNHLKIADPGYQNPDLTFKIDDLPPAFNTVQMCKLLLLDRSGLNTLLRAVGSPLTADATTVPQNNIMLGWLRSLDDGNQWAAEVYYDENGKAYPKQDKMLLARDGNTFRQIFRQQLGEEGGAATTGTSTRPPATPGVGYGTQPPVSSAPEDLSRWAGEWNTTMGRVTLTLDSDGALRGRLMQKSEFGTEKEGERLELRASPTEGTLVGTASYNPFVSPVKMTLSADQKSFTGTMQPQGQTNTAPLPWSGTRVQTASAPAPTAPTTAPATTAPPAGTSMSITGDGKFHPLSKFDVRLDRVEVARDRSIHAFVTFKNPAGTQNTLINNSIQAFLEDGDGVALRFGQITRASTPEPEPFADQPTLAPGAELKARFVLPTIKGGAPVRTLLLRENDSLASFDLTGIAVPGLVTEAFAGAPGASPEWKPLGSIDVRFDGARPQRGTDFTELFFSLKNPTSDVQYVGTPFRISATDADGLVVKDQGQIYPVRGITPDGIVWTPWVLPGREMRLRFLIRGAIGSRLTVEHSSNGAKQTFAAVPTAAP